MAEEQPTNTYKPEKKSNKTSIIIALLSVVIIIQGIKIYLDHQESVAHESQLTSAEEELATTIQQLNDIREELDEKITEIEALGGDVGELQRAKEEIDAELKRSRRANRQVIAQLRDKVEGYETLLKVKDQEIEKLKEINQVLLTENTGLKVEKNQLSDSITELSQSKEELVSKVEMASRLKAENIKIYSVNSRGKLREQPFRRKQLDKLRVEFNLAENDVAPVEGKNILIRIVDGNDQVIFDVARGSGTFMLGGKEEFYTANQEILFDNTRQQLAFEYEKGTEYESGLYTLEVYTDDYRMGSGQFVVK